MKRAWLKSRLITAVALLLGVSCGCFAQPRSDPPRAAQFSELADLRARHPAVVSDDRFTNWLKENGISRWHETRPEKDLVTVIVQSLKEIRLYAAQVMISQEGLRAAEKVVRAQVIDAGDNTRTSVLNAAAERATKSEQQVHAVRPVVTFLPNGGYRLTWQVEMATKDSIDTLEYDSKAFRPLHKRQRSMPAVQAPAVAPVPEDLSSNELHHLASFAPEAMEWTKGAATVREKVERIYANMNQYYTYDKTIVDIENFTWSDLLVRDTNGRRGICDEWAVVQVTYLRALGIPARLKLILWDEGGEQQAHSALEYRDGGTWHHLDSLWHAIDDPGVYRRGVNGKDFTVMDADEPLDSRSTVPAWDSPDPTGDGKLHPYLDFVLTPPYPGNARPGYSN